MLSEHPNNARSLTHPPITGVISTYLVLGNSNGFREGKERQGKVHEAVLIGLELLMTLNDLEQLQTH